MARWLILFKKYSFLIFRGLSAFLILVFTLVLVTAIFDENPAKGIIPASILLLSLSIYLTYYFHKQYLWSLEENVYRMEDTVNQWLSFLGIQKSSFQSIIGFKGSSEQKNSPYNTTSKQENNATPSTEENTTSKKQTIEMPTYKTLSKKDLDKINKKLGNSKNKSSRFLSSISPILAEIKIYEEDVFREALEEQPEIGGIYVPDQYRIGSGAYDYHLKNLLKSSVELSRESYKELFKIIDETCILFQIQPSIRVFKVKHGGTENAFVVSHDNSILLAFCDNILNLINNEEELRYIVGHELGHYVYRHTEGNLANYLISLYRSNEGSVTIKNLLSAEGGLLCLGLAFIISQIQELNADRAGLYASKSFANSIKASLKMSAGNVDKFGEYNYKDYLKQADDLINSGNYFDMEDLFRTHPIESLRVKALEFFYYSDVYSEKIERKKSKYVFDSFAELLSKIVPYIFTLAKIQSPFIDNEDYVVLISLATYEVIEADNVVNNEELFFFDKIKLKHALNPKAQRCMGSLNYPSLPKEKRLEILKEKAENFRNGSYRLKRIIIDQMLQAAKSDYQIAKEEVEFIVQVAEWMDALDICFTEFKNQLGWSMKKDSKGKLVIM